MKMLVKKLLPAGVGVFLTMNVAVHAATLYDNSSGDTGRSLSFTNGWTVGNEIKMGGGFPSALVTNFSFEIYSTLATFSGTPNMQVFLYANDGAPFNGYATPGTILYNSGLFSFVTPQQSSGIDAVTLNFDLSAAPVSVGNDFTFAAVVTGLASTDVVGMELFDPAGFGLNYGDYWLKNGSGWALLTNNVPTDFGARFSGTVTPEPSSLHLGVVGAALLAGITWLRRRQDSSRQVQPLQK